MTTLRPMNGRGPERWACPVKFAPYLEAFLTYLVSIGRSRGTIEVREKHLVHFARFNSKAPTEIVHDDIAAYFVENRHNAPETRRAKHASLKLFYGWLVHVEHAMTVDPTFGFPGIRVPRSEPRRCPDDVIELALSDPQAPGWVKLAIRILTNSGVRRAECAAIKPVDVTYSDGVPWLYVIGKGGHSRTVPLPDPLATEISSITTEYVFPATTETGCGHLCARYLGDRISDALPGKWTAHTLRHRYATVAYQHSNDIRSVQSLLGHSSIATTQRYVGVDRSAMVIAARAAMLAGGI